MSDSKINSSKLKIKNKNKKTKILGKNIWGPKAWHLLHSFSLHHNKNNILDKEKKAYFSKEEKHDFRDTKAYFSKEEKHDYYLFYKTFVYLIPCKICQLHYKNMFEIYEPLIEKDISTITLPIWVWKIHNRVNSRLGKKELTYEEGLKIQEKINNEDIFFFINNVILGLDIKKCCIHDFDQIYHFFYYFGLLYPDSKIQEKLKKLVFSDEYSNISSPREFKEWYQKTYKSWQE